MRRYLVWVVVSALALVLTETVATPSALAHDDCIVSPGVVQTTSTITGTAESDIIDCGSSSHGHAISGLGGDDRIQGSVFSDLIDAGAGNDAIRHGAEDDTIAGGPGDDTIGSEGGIDGDDSFDGGAGVDTVDYSGVPGSIKASLSTGIAHGGGIDTDLLVNIENLTGSNATWGNGDSLTGDGGPNKLIGGGGDDRLSGGGGDDELVGGDGYDVLNGGKGRDICTSGERE